MKLWVTRPYADEIYMGGDRSLKLWTTKPHFDHRACIHDFDLLDPSGAHFGSVYFEQGWVGGANGVKATPFLKQDRSVYDRVWELVCASLAPAIDPGSFDHCTPEKWARLLEPRYEMECVTHWKRFLVELDLRNDTVSLIEAASILREGDTCYGRPITEKLGLTHMFLDEDLDRPFFYADYPGYDTDRSAVF